MVGQSSEPVHNTVDLPNERHSCLVIRPLNSGPEQSTASVTEFVDNEGDVSEAIATGTCEVTGKTDGADSVARTWNPTLNIKQGG